METRTSYWNMDYLFEVSDEQLKRDVEPTNFSSLIKYDPGNAIFKSILKKNGTTALISEVTCMGNGFVCETTSTPIPKLKKKFS